MAATVSKKVQRASIGAQKQQGQSYDFITPPPEEFNCSICTGILRDPHLTECCGNHFCASCLREWKKSADSRTCPHCRAANFNHILDKRSRREIGELQVRCSFRSEGCKWEGELASLEEHLVACTITEVKCSKCFHTVKRSEIEKHRTEECGYRRSRCAYCNTEGLCFALTSSLHLSHCPGYPVTCPNKCSTRIRKRSEMAAHITRCPKEPVDCPFKDAGCKIRPERKDLKSHLDLENHQHMLYLMTSFQEAQIQLRQQSTQLEKQSSQLQEQSKQIRDLQLHKTACESAMKGISGNVDELLRIPNLPPSQQNSLQAIKSHLTIASPLQLDSLHPSLTLTVPNFAANTTWASPPFYMNEGYKMCLKLHPNVLDGKTISAELCLLQGEFDGELKWPCTVNFKCLYVHIGPTIKICVGEGSLVPFFMRPLSSSTLWQCVQVMENPPPARFMQPDGSMKLRLEYCSREMATGWNFQLPDTATLFPKASPHQSSTAAPIPSYRDLDFQLETRIERKAMKYDTQKLIQ